MLAFEQQIQSMANNFQIEIIRQFEIQKTQMENLVQEYLFDEEDHSEIMAAAAASNTDMAFEPDLADGDDLVFFDKYTGVNAAARANEDDVDDDSFDNGYYF